MKKSLINFVQQFFMCGLIGWCIEILFTSFEAFKRRDLRLKGTTSIWMFPIYGMAALLSPIMKKIHYKNLLFRGSFYAFSIITAEFLSGSFLKKRNLCPWDYSKCTWNIRGIIRLDYLPYWFITGLFFERLLCKKKIQKMP